ncbi:MAG: hypothetical protein RLZZ156_553 [Deinococcota bacterium]
MDVSFATDPRILRGTWTGTLEKPCDEAKITARAFNPSGTQVMVIRDEKLEIFDAVSGTKLGGFNVPPTKSPVVWSNDGLNLIYLRITNAGLERVVANPLTGADVSVIALTSDFIGVSYAFNADLTRMTVFATSGISGISRIDLYNLETSALIKSKNVTKIKEDSIQLSPDGTKILYGIITTTQFEIWQHDFVTDQTKKVFERLGITPISFEFNGNNQLNLSFSLTTNTNRVVRRINLTDLSTRDSLLPGALSNLVISKDGIRAAYLLGTSLVIKNLDTDTTVATTTLNSNSQNISVQIGVYTSNFDGTKWMVRGSKLGCYLRIFETAQQTLTLETSIGIEDSKIVTMKFVPTYQSANSYSITGTLKLGLEAERDFNGTVRLPEYCNTFSGNCEKLIKQTSATIPNPSFLERIHYVNLQYTTQPNFEYNITEVGYRRDNKKVQLYMGKGFNEQLALRLEPSP